MPQQMGDRRLPCTVVVRLIASMFVEHAYNLTKAFADRLAACCHSSTDGIESVVKVNEDNIAQVSAVPAVTGINCEYELSNELKGQVT